FRNQAFRKVRQRARFPIVDAATILRLERLFRVLAEDLAGGVAGIVRALFGHGQRLLVQTGTARPNRRCLLLYLTVAARLPLLVHTHLAAVVAAQDTIALT